MQGGIWDVLKNGLGIPSWSKDTAHQCRMKQACCSAFSIQVFFFFLSFFPLKKPPYILPFITEELSNTMMHLPICLDLMGGE